MLTIHTWWRFFLYQTDFLNTPQRYSLLRYTYTKTTTFWTLFLWARYVRWPLGGYDIALWRPAYLGPYLNFGRVVRLLSHRRCLRKRKKKVSSASAQHGSSRWKANTRALLSQKGGCSWLQLSPRRPKRGSQLTKTHFGNEMAHTHTMRTPAVSNMRAAGNAEVVSWQWHFRDSDRQLTGSVGGDDGLFLPLGRSE